jgi:hypothetical protein
MGDVVRSRYKKAPGCIDNLRLMGHGAQVLHRVDAMNLHQTKEMEGVLFDFIIWSVSLLHASLHLLLLYPLASRFLPPASYLLPGLPLCSTFHCACACPHSPPVWWSQAVPSLRSGDPRPEPQHAPWFLRVGLPLPEARGADPHHAVQRPNVEVGTNIFSSFLRTFAKFRALSMNLLTLCYGFRWRINRLDLKNYNLVTHAHIHM